MSDKPAYWSDKPAYCTKCGARLAPGGRFCSTCGALAAYPASSGGMLPPAPPPPAPWGRPYYAPPPEQDSGMSAVFPYKNGRALAAYYLGCFSFIIPLLALPAIVFGVLGYRRYRAEPRVKGAAHAVIGIVAALLACLLWAALFFSWNDVAATWLP
jgi:hypothetical protein